MIGKVVKLGKEIVELFCHIVARFTLVAEQAAGDIVRLVAGSPGIRPSMSARDGDKLLGGGSLNQPTYAS